MLNFKGEGDDSAARFWHRRVVVPVMTFIGMEKNWEKLLEIHVAALRCRLSITHTEGVQHRKAVELSNRTDFVC